MRQRLLRYRAGPAARRRIVRDGLRPGVVRAVVGPASGPKWLVLAGLDRALLTSDLLSEGRIVLAGASAGAWRMAVYTCRDPLRTHRALLDGYVGQVFPRGVDHRTVSAAYRRLLTDLLGAEAEGVVSHPVFDLAVHTVRQRFTRSRPGLAASLAAATALDYAGVRATGWFFERVLFHSRPENLGADFNGRVVPLDGANLVDAVLASGAVPIYLDAVRDPPGAPSGAYVDGGLTDYHLNQRWVPPGDGVVLMPHYRREVLARWLDKRRPSRALPADLTGDILVVHPSERFFARLPGGRIPDREDFREFADLPEVRIERWRTVAAESEALGEEFLGDLESGRLADLIEAL